MSINNRKWTTFTATISLACLCVFLPACSASTKQDAAVGMSSQEESGCSEKASSQEQPDNSEKAESQEETGGSASADNAEEKSESLLSKAQNLLGAEGKSEKTTNGSELLQDKAKVLMEGDRLYDIETRIPVSPLDTSKLSFLLCDVSIKNINLDLGELNITELQMACLKPDGKELRSTGLPAYFSEAADEVDGPKYYHLDILSG